MKDDKFTINLTPLSYVPGAKIEKYLGSLNFFLIRETSSLREVREIKICFISSNILAIKTLPRMFQVGGISSFVQSFVCEIYSIVRSHVGALGGNALVSFFISDLCVLPSVHKNQVCSFLQLNCSSSVFNEKKHQESEILFDKSLVIIVQIKSFFVIE